MAFAFDLTDPTLEAGLQRIARALLRKSISQIDTAAALESPTVHDLRKTIKKLRAALRLVRSGMPDVQAAENVILRDAGRALSGQRDGAVRLHTFVRLIGDQPPVEMAALAAHLTAGAQAASMPAPPGLRQTLADMLERVDDWRLKGSDRRIMKEGLAETRTRTRRLMQAAREDTTSHAMHEWRKRAKDHWYQARLLTPVWPEMMKPISSAAGRLGEALGDHHDLDMLLTHVAELPTDLVPAEVFEDLATRAADARHALEAQAFGLGARLFAGDPDEMADLWIRWWRLWRTERIDE